MGGGGGGGNMLRPAVGRASARSGGGAGLREPFSAAAAAAANPNSAPAAPNSTSAKSAASPSSKKQKKPHKLDPSHHRHYSLSSSSASAPSSAFNNLPWPPAAAAAAATSGVILPTWPPYPSAPQHDDSEWVYVDGNGEIAVEYFDDLVLGPVPSKCEVENAVSALQQVFDSTPYPQIRDRFGLPMDKQIENESESQSSLLDQNSGVGSELGQVDTANASDIRTLHPYGPERVYDAFDMLRNEPAVQRMVVSLSSDSAVWNAVLNNEVVKELRESYHAAESDGHPEESPKESLEGSPDNSNPIFNAVRWLFDSTRVKLMGMMESMANLRGKIFKLPAGNPERKDLFGEKLRTSFLLSIVVLVVVVVARARRG
ncbi:protein argonaute 14-like [Syzygium oleosum]|uniref:protein argonaute 14-like n=1 Tax=Syzygium oleosum TaxID=219896 RepID=UPI0024B9C890|nr:protein argonaute 14-like [Syzygium oleosum]